MRNEPKREKFKVQNAECRAKRDCAKRSQIGCARLRHVARGCARLRHVARERPCGTNPKRCTRLHGVAWRCSSEPPSCGTNPISKLSVVSRVSSAQVRNEPTKSPRKPTVPRWGLLRLHGGVFYCAKRSHGGLGCLNRPVTSFPICSRGKRAHSLAVRPPAFETHLSQNSRKFSQLSLGENQVRDGRGGQSPVERMASLVAKRMSGL